MAALTTFPTRWFASFVVKERWPCGLAVVSGGVGETMACGNRYVNTGGYIFFCGHEKARAGRASVFAGGQFWSRQACASLASFFMVARSLALPCASGQKKARMRKRSSYSSPGT